MDTLAEVIASRQRVDWRELRLEPFTSPQVAKALERLALQIREALPRVQTKRATPTTIVSPGAKPSATTTEKSNEQLIESPTAKTEPPTFIVDPWHRGDFTSLSEAIKTVAPGTRILVRPGLYQEGLVIDKPLEIIGYGAVGEIVIESEGTPVIRFQTTMGRIVNLTLRQIAGGKCYGVDIAQGRLELEDCDLTSHSFSCVAIHGSADPRLRRNRIHNSNQSGVLLYENAQGTIEDNDIFGNAFAGVTITGPANPTIRSNRIHGNTKGGGVLAHQNAQGILEDNEIFGNALAGVEIRDEASAIVRRNRIYDGKTGGVLISDHAQVTIEDNDIFGNTYSGVQITNHGNPAVRRNRIYENKQSGLYVYKEGQGILEENDIFANNNSGIYSSSGGNPIIKKNRINRNVPFGICVGENGRGTFEDNDLTENEGGAWSIDEESAPNITRVNNKE
jgi:F-box protein 11